MRSQAGLIEAVFQPLALEAAVRIWRLGYCEPLHWIQSSRLEYIARSRIFVRALRETSIKHPYGKRARRDLEGFPSVSILMVRIAADPLLESPTDLAGKVAVLAFRLRQHHINELDPHYPGSNQEVKSNRLFRIEVHQSYRALLQITCR